MNGTKSRKTSKLIDINGSKTIDAEEYPPPQKKKKHTHTTLTLTLTLTQTQSIIGG